MVNNEIDKELQEIDKINNISKRKLPKGLNKDDENDDKIGPE